VDRRSHRLADGRPLRDAWAPVEVGAYSSDSTAASTKLCPFGFMSALNSGLRQSDSPFTPRRLAAPGNFHDVRACVSSEVAQVMKSHVARFARGESDALIGNPKFQTEAVRRPVGPLGQRA
jgi:hypothetical protein